ncbi:Cell wall hydrolase, SleB [Moorella glycerini]|uniref:Spore cortex-lytic enzyme n=1 Tax=Neomoorella stamsii TaxID=1266720 RepID=A0A9X7P6S2_9FIRM|nr:MULTISPECIES: cell wall hydrolase [Moorella]PRR74619.1 Spore cortex-lytic enzyme precursor [Moorella stamsii]CEP69094.1 Cell wall hydrolase, SleB [Moorella glycerini]
MTAAPQHKSHDKTSFIIPATKEDLLLLARLIQAEAEAEPLEGMIAVGAVVVNRVRHPDFTDTIYAVIMEPGQFESVGNNRLASVKAPNEDSVKAATKALEGVDLTNGALFFYNPQLTDNQWIRSKKVKMVSGNHLFVV